MSSYYEPLDEYELIHEYCPECKGPVYGEYELEICEECDWSFDVDEWNNECYENFQERLFEDYRASNF